jgi:phytanoyl-CoA hydroxylase
LSGRRASEAGPLVFYPGTQKLEPYRFSHGGIDALDSEMPACREYLEAKLKESGARKEIFLGKAGDVFLWHGQLLHGGTGIKDLSRTRKTLVTHYWRAEDVQPERRVKVHRLGYYLRREHQAVAAG